MQLLVKEKLEGALGCAFDSVNDVHVDVVSKALNVNCRSTGKFMNVSCELFLTKRVLLPQHDDRSEHQDHEGANFSRVARLVNCMAVSGGWSQAH